MHEFNRRSTDTYQGVRGEIISNLESVTDSNLRIVLLLMLKFSDELSDKLDTILSDEKRIKDIVLGGKAESFSKIVSCHSSISGHCAWAEQKIQDELDQKKSTRNIRDSLIGHILIAVITFAAGAALGKLVGKF